MFLDALILHKDFKCDVNTSLTVKWQIADDVCTMIKNVEFWFLQRVYYFTLSDMNLIKKKQD